MNLWKRKTAFHQAYIVAEIVTMQIVLKVSLKSTFKVKEDFVTVQLLSFMFIFEYLEESCSYFTVLWDPLIENRWFSVIFKFLEKQLFHSLTFISFTSYNTVQ